MAEPEGAPPEVAPWAFCKRCAAGTLSIPCPRCDGPVPDKEGDDG